MSELSSHQFEDVYKELDVDVKELGCIMLDTETIPVLSLIDDGKRDLYFSKDKFWMNGAVAEHTAHLTLLYGLMKPGQEWKKLVDKVLNGWSIKGVQIDKVGAFENHYKDEDAYCIVAHIKLTDNLKAGNARLRFLPHIDTFPEYKPHVTLAYVKGDKATRDKWVRELNAKLSGKTLKVKTKLNYGGNK